MKVTNNNAVDPKILQGTSSLNSAKKSSNVKTSIGATYKEAEVAAGAKIELSAKAKEYQRIKDVATNSDDIDTAKVDRIKKALKDGKFEVDYEKVAEKIVENDIMYDLLS